MVAPLRRLASLLASLLRLRAPSGDTLAVIIGWVACVAAIVIAALAVLR